MARVKRIIMSDEDIQTCSTNAAFLISIATVGLDLIPIIHIFVLIVLTLNQEMFVRYLTEQAHIVVRSEKKPRRAVHYKDLAAAVARVDNLEFLNDIIPRTVQYKDIKEKKPRQPTTIKLTTGQTTLDKRQSNADAEAEPEAEAEADPESMDVDEREAVDPPEKTDRSAKAAAAAKESNLDW